MLRISPNGRRIVSASGNGTIKVWDADTGKEICTIPGHEKRVKSVTFSPDGRQIVTVRTSSAPGFGHAETMKVWDTRDGPRKYTPSQGSDLGLPAWRSVRTGVGLLASGDKRIRVWDAETGAEALAFPGKACFAESVAFSPDGRWIVSGGENKTIKVWDAEAGKEIRTLEGHKRAVNSVAGQRGQRVGSLAGAATRPSRYGMPRTGKDIHTLQGHMYSVESVAFSADRSRIVSASRDKTIKVWDAESGKEIRTLQGHEEPVNSVAFSPDARRIVSGSADKTIKLWDSESGEEIRTLQGHEHPVDSVAFSPDGRPDRERGRQHNQGVGRRDGQNSTLPPTDRI